MFRWCSHEKADKSFIALRLGSDLCSLEQGGEESCSNRSVVAKRREWINAPAELNARLQTGQAAILYFGADHSFAIIYCVVNRVPKQYVTISHGDGQVVYLGKWAAAGDQVSATYRLTSHTGAAQRRETARAGTTRNDQILGGKSYR